MGDDRAATLLKVMRWAMLDLLRERIEDRALLRDDEALVDYVRACMASAPIEAVRTLYLNAASRLIHDEVLCEGSVDQVPLYVREVVRRSLELGATSIIIVHNHPSGDARPGRSDRTMTRELAAALRTVDVHLADHIVVSECGTMSFRSLGLL